MFDAATYRSEVLLPTARQHARALQQALTEMKASTTTRPSSFDLQFLYQITSAMTDAEIATQLNDVEVCWNKEYIKTKDPKRKAAAGFVRQMHELLEKRNSDFATQKWWADSIAQKERAKLGIITKLAEVLNHSPYAGLKHITSERLASIATNDAYFSSFTDGDLRAAATAANLKVVEPVDLPDDPGIDNYSALIGDLGRAADPTIVHAVFFSKVPSSFSVLSGEEGGRPFKVKADGRVLDAATAAAARDANNASGTDEATARNKVLSSLATAAAKGTDLNTVVIYHLADEARHKCRGGVLQMAFQSLTDVGLAETDAARIVLSVDVGGVAKTAVTADAVRALLADGRLDAASHALSQLMATVGEDKARKEDAAALQTLVTQQRARIEELRAAAATAIRGNDIAKARTALLNAVTLDRENEDLARDLASLPPEPPNNVSAVEIPDDAGEVKVRVSWQPGLGSDDETQYCVVRKVGATPRNSDDGTPIGRVTSNDIVDDRPELVDETYYAVFASRGKSYSLPAAASITVVPGVARFTLSSTPTGVGGHWVNPPRTDEIAVMQIGPDGSRTRIPLSSPASFTSDGLVQGKRYRYEVIARYRTRAGMSVASKPVVAEAIPRAEARPVPSLSVQPMVTPEGMCRVEAHWSRQPSHEVQLWCFPQPPAWSYGTRVSAADLSGRGRQLHGQGVDKAAVSNLVADVPAGLMHYVVVTVDGDSRVVGQTDHLGICDPVGNPRVERFGEEAVLSWDWPSADYSVRAVWSGPSTSGEATITKTRYDSSGGMRIRVGSGRSDIRLTTFIDHAEGQWQSPLRALSVEAASATISYAIVWQKKLFGSAGGFDVKVVADGDVSTADLVIGYRADRVMPSSMKRIDELQRHALHLTSGESVTYSVVLPKMPKHYWVRCFLDATEGIRIVDPPTDDLRGR